MAKKVAVMLADGFEPVEVVAPVDVMRRAGLEVALVSISNDPRVRGAQGIELNCGALLGEVDLDDFDLVILPGGSDGVERLSACEPLGEALKHRAQTDGALASICAGPMVLDGLGLLAGKRAVCYPGCQTDFPQGLYQEAVDVCVDGHLVTATGPATALPFGVECVRLLCGSEIADSVAEAMLINQAAFVVCSNDVANR